MRQFYVMFKSRKVGPYPHSKIGEAVRSGRIDPESTVIELGTGMTFRARTLATNPPDKPEPTEHIPTSGGNLGGEGLPVQPVQVNTRDSSPRQTTSFAQLVLAGLFVCGLAYCGYNIVDGVQRNSPQNRNAQTRLYQEAKPLAKSQLPSNVDWRTTRTYSGTIDDKGLPVVSFEWYGSGFAMEDNEDMLYRVSFTARRNASGGVELSKRLETIDAATYEASLRSPSGPD